MYGCPEGEGDMADDGRNTAGTGETGRRPGSLDAERHSRGPETDAGGRAATRTDGGDDGGREVRQAVTDSSAGGVEEPLGSSDGLASVTEVFGRHHAKEYLKGVLTLYGLVGLGVGLVAVLTGGSVGGVRFASGVTFVLLSGPLAGAAVAARLVGAVPESGDELYVFLGGAVAAGTFVYGLIACTLLAGAVTGFAVGLADVLAPVLLGSVPAGLVAAGVAWAVEDERLPGLVPSTEL